MPTINVEITEEVDRALSQQARALLLSRSAYVRAVLAAVVAQALRESGPNHKGRTR